jgi:hypothetical protein
MRRTGRSCARAPTGRMHKDTAPPTRVINLRRVMGLPFRPNIAPYHIVG